MRRLVSRQVEEIGSDWTLRLYGAALAGVNALTCIHWMNWPRLDQILAPETTPVCWPFFDGCQVTRVVQSGGIVILVTTMLVLSIWNAERFVKKPRTAWWALVALTTAKYLVIALDFRLTLNHHYMSLWIVVPFLFLPRKRQTVTWLIVCMYFFAGALKANPDSHWLTGAAFYGRKPLGLPASLIPLECAYVMVLELALVFGLLAKNRWVFWTTLGQFVLFHIASFWVVGFFYPILMFLLLSILPLQRFLKKDDLPPSRWHWPATISGLFAVAQSIPFLFAGDSSITGEGRLFALNMFDAPLQCEATLTTARVGELSRVVALHPPFVNTRTMCDPIVYLNLTRAVCKVVSRDVNVTLQLASRKVGEPEFRNVVFLRDFCAVNPSYSLLTHNWWINQ